MNPAITGALVTGGADLIGSALNAFSTYKTNQQQYQYNKALAEQAYERNVAQWMRENAYNTPAMQMARMRAAGLNPNMPFGDGVDVSSGNAGASPQLNYGAWNPQAPMFDASSPIQNAMQAYLLEAKRDNINANTEKTTGETKKILRETQNLEVDYDIKKKQLEGLGLDNQAKEIANRFLEREKKAKIDNLESGTQLNKEQARQVSFITDKILPKEVELKNASLKDFEEKWNRWHAEIEKWATEMSKTEAEKNLLVMDAENYALNHMSSGFMGTGISFQNAGRMVREGGKTARKVVKAAGDSAKEAWSSGKKAVKKLKFW